MSRFIESGMIFVFPDDMLFRIEHSQFYKQKKALSSVECLCLMNKRMHFIEAKSSFPRAENALDFEKNLSEVSDKFLHSFELFLSHFVNVNPLLPEETPVEFINYEFSKKNGIVFVLIINCKKIEKHCIPNMISTIQNAFLQRFEAHKSIWGIRFITLDHESAIARKFIEGLKE